MIDRLREQIHQYLDQLADEAERLRKALAALDPRSSKTPRKPGVRKAAEPIAAKPAPSASTRTSAGGRARRRPPPLAGRRPGRPGPRCSPRSPAARR